MPQFIVGARLHDYGQGAVDEQFAKAASDIAYMRSFF